MNEQNITVSITAEVKVNGVVVPDAQVQINKVVIGQITLPNVDVSL
jgi:hypothetical protein